MLYRQGQYIGYRWSSLHAQYNVYSRSSFLYHKMLMKVKGSSLTLNTCLVLSDVHLMLLHYSISYIPQIALLRI